MFSAFFGRTPKGGDEKEEEEEKGEEPRVKRGDEPPPPRPPPPAASASSAAAAAPPPLAPRDRRAAALGLGGGARTSSSLPPRHPPPQPRVVPIASHVLHRLRAWILLPAQLDLDSTAWQVLDRLFFEKEADFDDAVISRMLHGRYHLSHTLFWMQNALCVDTFTLFALLMQWPRSFSALFVEAMHLLTPVSPKGTLAPTRPAQHARLKEIKDAFQMQLLRARSETKEVAPAFSVTVTANALPASLLRGLRTVDVLKVMTREAARDPAGHTVTDARFQAACALVHVPIERFLLTEASFVALARHLALGIVGMPNDPLRRWLAKQVQKQAPSPSPCSCSCNANCK